MTGVLKAKVGTEWIPVGANIISQTYRWRGTSPSSSYNQGDFAVSGVTTTENLGGFTLSDATVTVPVAGTYLVSSRCHGNQMLNASVAVYPSGSGAVAIPVASNTMIGVGGAWVAHLPAGGTIGFVIRNHNAAAQITQWEGSITKVDGGAQGPPGAAMYFPSRVQGGSATGPDNAGPTVGTTALTVKTITIPAPGMAGTLFAWASLNVINKTVAGDFFNAYIYADGVLLAQGSAAEDNATNLRGAATPSGSLPVTGTADIVLTLAMQRGAGTGAAAPGSSNGTQLTWLFVPDALPTDPVDMSYFDSRYVNVAGDAMSGTLSVDTPLGWPSGNPSVAGLRLSRPSDFWTSDESVLFFNQGYVGHGGSHRLGLFSNGYRNVGGTWTPMNANGTAGACSIQLDPSGQILFCGQSTNPTGQGGAVENMRINAAGNLLIGKTAASTSVIGGEIYDFGYRAVTASATMAAFDCRWLTGATTMALNMIWNGTAIGSITRNGTNNGVVYNTTSHGPWKGNVATIDDADALDTIMTYRPVSYQWKLDVNGQMSEWGTPQGETQRGFIAQEHEALIPYAVSPAVGKQNQEGFQPAGFDYGRITPDLVAAIQAVIRKVDSLETRIVALEAG